MPAVRAVAFDFNGDTEAGVAAVTSAGCRCVALAGTAPPARLHRAEEIVESIDVALVERLLA